MKAAASDSGMRAAGLDGPPPFIAWLARILEELFMPSYAVDIDVLLQRVRKSPVPARR